LTADRRRAGGKREHPFQTRQPDTSDLLSQYGNANADDAFHFAFERFDSLRQSSCTAQLLGVRHHHMKELLPQTLNRLDYFVGWLMFTVPVICWTEIMGRYIKPSQIPIWVILVNISILAAIRFTFLDIPRCRSLKWSPWLVALLLIPMVKYVIQLLLIFTPAKHADA
jgi:hypothetical protein